MNDHWDDDKGENEEGDHDDDDEYSWTDIENRRTGNRNCIVAFCFMCCSQIL